MVHSEHRSAAAEQVPPQQLRVQVPDLPHHVPHDCLLAPQLRRRRVAEDRSDADGSIPGPVRQDLGSEPRLLRVGGVRERLPEVSPRFVHSGDWGYDAVFHGGVCVVDDDEEGGLVDLLGSCACGGWCCYC